MLTVTERAVAAIKSVREDDTQGLRISVASGGCSGLKYSLGLETTSETGDEVLEFGGIKVFIDAASVMYLAGTVVDFVNAGNDSGFIFENPNAGGKCSCSGGSC
jgi:iron-sulfur cluster assembly accessory protein